MAEIKEEIIAIKISTLVKNVEDADNIITDDMVATLEEAVGALVGVGHVVEIITE